MPSARPPTAPLHKAVVAGDTVKVRKYISVRRTRIDKLSNGRTALAYAVSSGNYEIAQLLLEAGASPDIPAVSTGLAPIHIAANAGDLRMVSLLVEHGSNTQLQGNSPNETWTPLNAASKNDHWEVVRYLKLSP